MGGKKGRKRRNMAELASDLNNMADLMDDDSSTEATPATPSKSPPSKLRAVDSDDSATRVILEKLSSIEKSSQATAKAMDALTATVQSLLNRVTTHSEKIQKIDLETEKLQKENLELKMKLNDMQRHSRLWNLKLHGVKEENGENIRQITMDILSKVAPQINDKMALAVDIAHRLGTMKKVGSPRTIIIRFTMRFYRDIIWREAKNSGFLRDNNLRIKEALTPEDAAAREKLWPLVKKARDEGKRASFRGPFAYIEGKKIDCLEVN